MSKKEELRRRSLNNLIDAAIADNEDVTVAGLTPTSPTPTSQSTQPTREVVPAPVFSTKKATTIMPKEVFNKLQMYCTETDTPKHRALYMFLIEGLLRAGAITEDEYRHFKDLAALLITTPTK